MELSLSIAESCPGFFFIQPKIDIFSPATNLVTFVNDLSVFLNFYLQ